MMKMMTIVPFVLALVAGPAAADMRTKPIKLLHHKTWEAAPGPIAVSASNNSDHEKSQEFFEAMEGWVIAGFEKLKYTIDEEAELRFEWSLDIYDPGSAGKRMLVGFGAGTAHAQGKVTVRQGEEVVGEYEFSARPKMKGGAKQVGPILALKIHQGGSDEALHEFEKAAKKKE